MYYPNFFINVISVLDIFLYLCIIIVRAIHRIPIWPTTLGRDWAR